MVALVITICLAIYSAPILWQNSWWRKVRASCLLGVSMPQRCLHAPARNCLPEVAGYRVKQHILPLAGLLGPVRRLECIAWGHLTVQSNTWRMRNGWCISRRPSAEAIIGRAPCIYLKRGDALIMILLPLFKLLLDQGQIDARSWPLHSFFQESPRTKPIV